MKGHFNKQDRYIGRIGPENINEDVIAMKWISTPLTIFTISLSATAATAATWTLNPDVSVLSFGSIKNDSIGEAHTLPGLSGGVADDGSVEINVGLDTANTNIEIRDERMQEHVFSAAPTAELKAQIDMDALENLESGASETLEVDGTLTFMGNDIPVYLDVFLLRLSDDQVMVSSNTATYLSTDELGIDQGIDELQKLAELGSITRVTPVTFRFMFQQE